MNFIPLGQRILVEDIVEKYEGKLEIPPTSHEKPMFRSRVVAMSSDINNPAVSGSIKTPIKVGDIICRGEFIGQILEQKKDDLCRLKYQSRVMNVADALCIKEE